MDFFLKSQNETNAKTYNTVIIKGFYYYFYLIIIKFKTFKLKS